MSRRRQIVLFVVLLLVVGVAIRQLVGVFTSPTPPGAGVAAPCELQTGPCPGVLEDGTEISLGVAESAIVGFEPTTFVLRANVAPPVGKATLTLEMPGMSMGVPPLRLAPGDDGVLRGTATVPMCPTGHAAWTATVEVPGRGAARFAFHVTPP